MTKSRGFLLGKFMPPHRGHVFLCESALRMVDTLTVLVCSNDAERIPGNLRHQWMQAVAPGARVLHLHRDMPQEPEDHPDFWRLWREAIKEIHPDTIDRVFASEDYVFPLARECDAEPVLLDPGREIFSVSGSAICEKPAAHWDDIARPARAWFQKRLCILGPESTGKSQLATRLAAHFNTRAMPEYGRAYDIYYKQGENWTAGDLLTLAQTHVAMREAMAPEAGPLLLEDTDAIQTAIWAEFLLGAPTPALDDFAASTGHADHYLLLSPDVQWVDDGVRYAGGDDTRRWFFEAARERLDALRLSFHVISGANWAMRTRQATEIADQLFGDCHGPG